MNKKINASMKVLMGYYIFIGLTIAVSYMLLWGRIGTTGFIE